jgi:hypothetical protein
VFEGGWKSQIMETMEMDDPKNGGGDAKPHRVFLKCSHSRFILDYNIKNQCFKNVLPKYFVQTNNITSSNI